MFSPEIGRGGLIGESCNQNWRRWPGLLPTETILLPSWSQPPPSRQPDSAGQGAVFLSAHASKVRMMVRGASLADSMSRYLIDRIGATPNIELMTQTEIVALGGAASGNLERVRWRDHRDGRETGAAVRNVFLFVGADPATEWLQGCVALDKAGFVTTGGGPANGGLATSPLESSAPGVFAVGDVRSGSVKRVGGAIGEGAQVVAAIHRFLSHAAGPHL